MGFPTTQEPAQEHLAARPAPDGEVAEGSGPKKMTKQTRIKSQGPYARPDTAASEAGALSASAHGAQEEGTPERPADRETEAGDAE